MGTRNGFIDKSGRSSGVERNLAKVEVVSSNLIARSSFKMQKARGRPRAFAFVRRPASWRPRLFHLFLGLSQPLQWADDWVGLGVGKIVRKDRRRPIAIRGGGRRSEASAIKRVLKQT